MQWLPNIMSAVYAVFLVSHGVISLGGLVAFILILNKFVDAFIELPFCMVDASAGVVSVKRVEEILNASEERGGTENTALDANVAIYFDKVDFRYTEEKQVLHELSFEVKQGENVAFVGESGGGKSTIFHILCGFYPKTSGQYQLLGRNIEDWNREALREQISLVSQNVFLFPTTIEENVGYGKSDATHDEIVEACKKAEIHEFIMTLPQGYQTLVGERGAILSGGQKQRISIARAILKDAPILLLDEPTSALDVETESNIQDAINAVMEGRTCITIAHRLSTVVNADRIMVLKQGRVVESGTHEQLMEIGQEYAKESNKKILYTACLECSGKGFELLCSLVFLVIGILFVNKGYTTLGALTAIYTMYGAFSFQFLQMGKYIPELVGCLANAKNIFDFLDEAREPKNWYTEDVLEAANKEADMVVSINTITFSYDGNGDVLKDFSLDVKQGECIAITGASGCGKTTLSKLLLGLYPLNGGTIKVNGKDFRNCCLGDLRKQIAYVPQEPYLFNGSILDNIRMGRPQATEDEIRQAAKLANAHEFIVDFVGGYETNVGERGNNLSGGQRQRIAIARAILKDAPIILMDEATSALDNESEKLVNDALKNLHGKKTIVMIAHRPSTVQLADRVCCMG